MRTHEQILDSLGEDAVGALRLLFGVGSRTAERWVSGASRMPPHVAEKLDEVLDEVDEAEAELRASGRRGVILRLAAGRLPADPID